MTPIQTALVAAIQSPAAQAALESAITAGEVPLQAAIDAAVANLKVGGAAALIVNPLKGAIEAEINTEFSKLPPSEIASFLTSLAVKEIESL